MVSKKIYTLIIEESVIFIFIVLTKESANVVYTKIWKYFQNVKIAESDTFLFLKQFNRKVSINDNTINNKEVILKKTFKSYIIFEDAIGKPFHIIPFQIKFFFFYIVFASDTSLEVTFDDFLNW